MKLDYNDKEDFIKIAQELKYYDIFDVIKKISSLNLLPENQNKSILLDGLIEAILSMDKDFYENKRIISNKKFHTIIDKLNQSNIAYAIDPCENVFAQKVFFGHNDYYVFNGIDNTPAYNIQMFINALFLYDNNLPSKFLRKVFSLFHLLLSMSNSIYTCLNLCPDNVVYDEGKEIFIPSSARIKFFSSLIELNYEEIDKIQRDFDINELCITPGTPISEDVDNLTFYTKPFIRNPNIDSLIILNVSLLPMLAIYKTIEWANDFGVKDEVLKLVNNCVWHYTLIELKEMGYSIIDNNNFELELFDDNYYKESIKSAYNNKILLTLFICDDGYDYLENNIHDAYPNDKHSLTIIERLEYLIERLSNNNISTDDIYVLIITQGIGRTISCGITLVDKNIGLKIVSLNLFELHCINVNEKKNKDFLLKYMMAKSKINSPLSYCFSELNIIAYYTENNNSFYFSDDMDPTNLLYYFQSGYSVDYIQKAIDAEDLKTVNSYEPEMITLVSSFDKCRNIYIEKSVAKRNNIAFYIEFANFNIWLTYMDIKNEDDLNLMYFILDGFSYWFAECKTILDKFNGDYRKLIVFEFEHNDEIQEFLVKRDNIDTLDKCMKVLVDYDYITVNINPNFVSFFNAQTNAREKTLINYFIELFQDMFEEQIDYVALLDYIFGNPLKKKFSVIENDGNPNRKPIANRRNFNLSIEIEDMLLGLIGKELLKSNQWKIGVVPNNKRYQVTKEVVSLLYLRLQNISHKINSVYLIKTIYKDIEEINYDLAKVEKNYFTNIALYPEKNNEILTEINEINRTSISLRFLIEYITATNSNGVEPLSEDVYTELVTICYMIIDWAYKGDMFNYNIINTPIEFLNSKRIGMKKEELDNIFKYETTYRENMLSYNSSSAIRKLYKVNNVDLTKDFLRAFETEFGYDFVEFDKIINSLIEVNNQEVICMSENEVLSLLSKMNTEIKNETIINILKDITYTQRENFLELPKAYENWESWPWRFNRRYSFNRRPILKINDDLIWGNRQLYLSLNYLVDLIFNGKLKCNSKEMEQFKGKVTFQKGKEFNEFVFKKINDITSFTLYSNVKKVNNKKIANDNNEDLGDIDILAIDDVNKILYAIEVKRFKFSKNPYEIKKEYEKMFDDSNNVSFSTKHMKRVQWLKKHIKDVKQEYNLTDEKWKVKGMFIVNEPLISKDIYNKDIKCVSIPELTKDSF